MKAVGLGVLLLTTVPAILVGQEAAFPWKAGDAPPTVAGVTLGTDLSTLDRLLGTPSAENKPRSGVTSRLYEEQGLSIVHHEGKGVVYILVFTREAGEIGGLRVGDPRETVSAKWGKPHAGRAETTLYSAGAWTVAVQLEPMTEFVHQLAIGRAEMFPASEGGLVANIRRVLVDLLKYWKSLGVLSFLSISNFLLLRRHPVPGYVHLLAFLAFATILALNWMWIQAGGELTVRRVIIIAIFPMTVYFFFVGMGGLKAAAKRGAS